MAAVDIEYLCTVIGNLSGIPIRLYRNGEQIFHHSLVNLPKDPICLYLDRILSIKEHIGYFVTPIFNYYGIVNSGASAIVIGPTRQLAATDQELRELSFRTDVPSVDMDDFVIAMKNIVPMTLDSILQILFTLNHILNGEKLNLEDIKVFGNESSLPSPSENDAVDNAEHFGDMSNNSFALEQTLMSLIRHGDTASMREWMKKAPAVNSGIIAHDQLRQLKNTFIVSTTLACRNAIRGGMDVHDSLSLSDAYIQKCELLTSLEDIVGLQYQMVLDYTERVEKIRRGKNPSKLVIDVTNYVLHHISEPIKTEDIARALYFSRSRLSTRFKEETGVTLTDYILKEKSIEAKRLLRYSGKSIATISGYLGFSSQSHFNRVFKKYIGISPSEYRERKQ